MHRQVADLNVRSNIPLPPPALMLHEIPRSEAQEEFVAEAREAIRRILRHEDERFLLILGPCSIHDVRGGRDYAEKLRSLAERVRDQILIVMRCYFEKPRTMIGWKGLIMDPGLDGSNNIPEGLRLARRFLREVIDLGVPTATELLDPITPQYVADLICWSAIGARTTESQTHRQMASGLSMPLGFKNATSGHIEPAIHAIQAARIPQTFLGLSGKDHTRQPDILRDIVAQRKAGTTSIIGAMIESNLREGKQPFPNADGPLQYGVSITDACIGWEQTERLVLEVAEQVTGPARR